MTALEWQIFGVDECDSISKKTMARFKAQTYSVRSTFLLRHYYVISFVQINIINKVKFMNKELVKLSYTHFEA